MPLINFYQLRKMSEALQSYDAEKVQTKVKKPENGGNYTVEELFGKTAGDIDAVKKLLDDFKAKKIRDVVRLELPVAEGKASIPEDLSEKVPGIDIGMELPAYTVDNALVVDEKGARLTVNLKTGNLSGTPSVLDAEATAAAEDGKTVYKPLAVASVKVFPVGEWTLESLPSEALLDNDEMQLVAYRSAVDQIVVELAKDKNLILAIKDQIGQRAIADALAEKAAVADVFSVSEDGAKTPLYRTTDKKIARADLDSELLSIASNEEQLDKDVKSLQESYDASKVLVEQKKDDGTRYTVEDILSHKILVRRKLLVEDLARTSPEALFGTDAERVQKEVLKVYAEDGSRLYTENGEPLELNTETGELSDKAYALDDAEYRRNNQKCYNEYAGKAIVFPHTSMTLLELSSISDDVEPAAENKKQAAEKNRINIPKTEDIPAWEAGHTYLTDDIVRNGEIEYICTRRHASNTFDEKFWHEINAGQKVFGYQPEYSQVEVSIAGASEEVPVSKSITVKDDDSFCYRPLGILRCTEAAPETVMKDIAGQDSALNTVVKPEELFRFSEYKKIGNISVAAETAGTSKVMLAVTGDGETFQSYDREKKQWTVADTSTVDAFLASAMEAPAVAEIPEGAWAEIAPEKKVGFAYLLYQEEKKAEEPKDTNTTPSDEKKDADASGTEPAQAPPAETTEAAATEQPKENAGAGSAADNSEPSEGSGEDETKKDETPQEPDVCKLGAATITVYPPDFWRHAAAGTDYDYEYHVGGKLKVSFLKDGDYKINYDSGYRRGE